MPETHSGKIYARVRLEPLMLSPSHRSRFLEVLAWQYFQEPFCSPKVRVIALNLHWHCWEREGGEQPSALLRADFREGDEDSNFSVFRVRRFTESPGPLHWRAFPVEILTKTFMHRMPPPFSPKIPFFTESAWPRPLPQNREQAA